MTQHMAMLSLQHGIKSAWIERSSHLHQSGPLSHRRHHWTADNGILFPQKLWEAVNSEDSLITWNESGDAVVINDAAFEARVMSTFPELVIINSFANLRRQFREYGFEWFYQRETDEFCFSHPNFRLDSPDSVALIVTRRKRSLVRSKQSHKTPGGLHRNSVHHFTGSLNHFNAARNHTPISKLKNDSVKPLICIEDSQSEKVVRHAHALRCDSLSASFFEHRDKARSDKLNIIQWDSPGQLHPSQQKGARTTEFPDLPDLCPVGMDAEEEPWSLCVPWLVQQDAEMCSAQDVRCLVHAAQQARVNVQIPVYFHGNDFDYNVAHATAQ